MPIIGRKKVDSAIIATVKRTNNKVKKLYFQGLRDIIIGTPVDEGRARSNWFLTSGLPSRSTTSSGTRVDNLSLPKTVIGKKFYFTNNLPYIETLEYGGFRNKSDTEKVNSRHFSKQAPSGWVRIALRNMSKKVKTL